MTRIKKPVIWYGIVLFIISISYFALRAYNLTRPLRAYADTPALCTSIQSPRGDSSANTAPIWCYPTLAKGKETAVYGNNTFADEFNHGKSFADCCGGYTTFDISKKGGKATYWQHDNHFIVDTAGMESLIRPNKAFTFEKDSLVVEVDVASNMPGFNDKIWPEIIISSSSSPDSFANHWRITCELQGSKKQIDCTATDAAGKDMFAGRKITSGIATGQRAAAWKECKEGEPATSCLNRFRFELTKNSITSYVNGVRYFSQSGLNAMPARIAVDKMYVYVGTKNLNPVGSPYRIHWDRIAVNPKTLAQATVLSAVSSIATQSASLELSGKGSAVVPHVTYYNGKKGWTIETWFKDESKDYKNKQGYNHPTRYLLTKGDTENTEDIPFILGIEWNHMFVGTKFGGLQKTLTYNLTANNIGFDQWQHAAATFDHRSRELTLYINGLPVASSILPAYDVKNNMKPLYMGRNGNQHHWVGKMDDVRIWDKPRTAVEIRTYYQDQIIKAPPQLVGNWKFDDVRQKTAIDSSGHHEHATITGGVSSKDTPHLH